MTLRFATSEKEKRTLIDNGHVYIKDKSKRCHGRVHMIRDSIVKMISEHNHSGAACRAEVPISVMTCFETPTVKAIQHEFIGIQLRGFFFFFIFVKNDGAFDMQMRHLPSLAFVPVDDVVLAFEELLAHNTRRPHSMWSCYDTINDDSPKTNISCDGWHRSFSELIGRNHPTKWKFITVLQMEQGLNEAKIEQYFASVETYKEIDLMDYLRELSHNLSF
ncbi:hypothetical protein ACJMK2_007433 [Sinanodonta woodiana]|uniref:MULE transposase domain-containing protein n=1 Tax=Sinanodonta woodiana TaxID=1069815 RepID=A0ABD3VL09_SINWO